MDDFESFVQANAPALAGVAYLLCGHEQTAEDLVQTALTKAHRAWRRVQAADRPDAYVRQILVREYLSWRRRRMTTEIPTDTHQLMDQHPDEKTRTVEAFGENDEMWQLLHQLPRQQRAALVMRFYLDLPDPEIADHLGCRVATVRSHISHGLKTLRTLTRSHSEEYKR